MENLEFFSDNLPYRLPLWHSVQSSNKKFSIYKNHFDLDIVTDFGGHMLDYDKKTDEFKQIKNDDLTKTPLQIKSYLTPFDINCKLSTKSIELNTNKLTECLVCDQNLNILISTNCYNHPDEKQLIIKELNKDDDNLIKGDLIFYLPKNNGNIEQVNKFFNLNDKQLTYVRQDKCITLFELEDNILDYKLYKINKFLFNDKKENYLYSDHNTILQTDLLTISKLNNKIKINELDLLTNSKKWSINFDYIPDQLSTIKYTGYHPKIFHYLSSNQLNSIDIRSSNKNLLIDKTKLNSICSFENFKQLTNSIENTNLIYVASDYNLMAFDIRYPNYVLLQWNHMLTSNTDLLFIRNLKLEHETIFLANREEISVVTVQNKYDSNLINPTSLHFPLHLPKLNNIIKYSDLVDLRLQNYIDNSKIVGLDFIFNNNDNFDLYLMNQYGDLFKQNLLKTKLDNQQNILDLKLDSKLILNQKLEYLKDELLNKRREEISDTYGSNGFISEMSINTQIRKPINKSYWLKFANALKNNLDYEMEKLNGPKEVLDTNELIKKLKKNLGKDNIKFINRLQTIFKEDKKEFESNDLSGLKWSGFSYKLMNAWNLNSEEEIERLNQLDQDLLKEKASQDFILSQYI